MSREKQLHLHISSKEKKIQIPGEYAGSFHLFSSLSTHPYQIIQEDNSLTNSLMKIFLIET